MCLSVCQTTNTDAGFLITGAAFTSQVGTGTRAAGTCYYDFLQIAGGSALVLDTGETTLFVADRYCGGRLNPGPAGQTGNVQVCSKFIFSQVLFI